MKIGVLIDRLNVGGVEKIAIEQVKALREIGEDAYLVILREKAVVENAFPDLIKHIPIIYLDRRIPPILKFSLKFPIFHFFQTFHVTYPLIIPFYIKKHEFDYLIVHGTYTAFTAIFIRKKLSIPFSTFIWDPISYILERVYTKKIISILIYFLMKIAKYLDKIIITNSDVILVGGNAHDNFFNKIAPNKKIIEISPSVYPLAKLSQNKKTYILMVTAWKLGKNPEYIFKLLEKLPKIKIIMAGRWLDKDYLKHFKNKVKRLGYEKQINITGEVTEEALAKYYSEALFVLQTNDDRGFGLPALEAAGRGTTFIIPEGQGVCNLFTNNVDGFFTKEYDTKKIIYLIQKLQNNKLLASTMGEHGWNKVKEQYSWDKHAKVLSEIAHLYSNKEKNGL